MALVASRNVSVIPFPHASAALPAAQLSAAARPSADLVGSAAITGAVWSSTLIVWLAVLLLAHASVAVHVRVTLSSAPRNALVASLNVSVNPLPHASVALAAAKLGAAGHSIVLGRGSAA